MPSARIALKSASFLSAVRPLRKWVEALQKPRASVHLQYQIGDADRRQTAFDLRPQRFGDVRKQGLVRRDAEAGSAQAAEGPGRHAVATLELTRAFRDRLNVPSPPHSGSEIGHVTASIGVATKKSCASDITPSWLLDEADQALYSAKQNGRDQVVASRGVVTVKHAS